MKKCIKFIIKGKVQGVFYRKFISQKMNEAGFSGYVKNLKNGDVEAVVVIHNKDEKEKAIAILQEGSPASRVDEIIETSYEQSCEFDKFEIRYE